MTAKLDYLVSRELSEGLTRRRNLELLRDVCRAARHGRLPDSLRSRYQGILRHLRPQVASALRAGDRIPTVIAEEIERAAEKRRHKSPGRSGGAAARGSKDDGEQAAN